MIRGEDAVGGFFEDLPVLALVLMGTLTLLSSSVVSSQELSADRDADRLDALADGVVKGIVSRLTGDEAVEVMPTVSALRHVNLSAFLGGSGADVDCCAGIMLVHPRAEWLCSFGTGDPHGAVRTGFREAVMNALCDDGSVAVAVVRAIVW